MKYGKLPRRPGSIKIDFRDVFDVTKLPALPTTGWGVQPSSKNYGMLGNDKWGNCIAEQTEVSGPDIRAAYKIKYDGPVIVISLASGKKLTVTPKHAVLTTKGFSLAETLKEGDYLVGTRGTQVLPRFTALGTQIDFNKSPSPVEKVFSSLAFSGLTVRKIMPMAVDFHGDEKFFNGDIQIVRPDSFLRGQFDTLLRQPNAQNKISSTGQLKRLFVRLGAPLLAFGRGFLTAHGDICFGSNRALFGYAHVGITKSKRLSLGSQFFSSFNNFFFEMSARDFKFNACIFHRGSSDIFLNSRANISVSLLGINPANLGICSKLTASSDHPSAKSHCTDPNLFRNLSDAFPGLIEADHIISIHTQRYMGAHVYDLSTDCRWYLANGIVTHNCVIAGGMHESIILNTEAGNPVPHFTNLDAADEYAAITGFNLSDPSTDQGTDVQAAAAYRQKIGYRDSTAKRHKIIAYVAVNSDDLPLAAYTLGAAGWGLNVPSSAQDQFTAGQPWTFVPGDPLLGGHYVPVVGETASGNLVVITWGQTQEVTRPFYNAYFDEGAGYVSQEFLNNATHLSPEQFDLVALQSFLAKFGAAT
jgi:hypothetical protein